LLLGKDASNIWISSENSLKSSVDMLLFAH